jgi:hypothetical protein
VNVQSATGVQLCKLQRLEDCEAFYPYKSPWIPEKEWNKIKTTVFNGADKNIKELTEGTPYTDWRSCKRAITRAGSLVHFYQVGPVWMTTQNSFDFGIRRVMEVQQAKEERNHFVSTTDCGAGTAAKGR